MMRNGTDYAVFVNMAQDLMGVILELILTRLCQGGKYEVLLKLLRYGLISPNSSFV
jgi:hypothetical protein